ncbi:MAG TPA: M28 family peptidase [Actinomycetota bacterium]|nr:M28 family peptidase [Actinomycetota bacterium]
MTLAVLAASPSAASGSDFSRSKAMGHVRRLASGIGPRVRGSRAEKRASRYVAREFDRLGYRVKIQRFGVDGRRSRNVVAWWPGAVEHPLVIGGHMDTVPGSPGANDNASGVAVVLELARIAAGTTEARFLRFVAFGSEEYGDDGRHHVGSATHVRRLGSAGVSRTPGMVSVDMIADGRPLIVSTTGMAPKLLARILVRTFGRAGIRAVFDLGCDCSDHGPFERAGIPGAFLWSGDEPDYHSPSDTPRNLEPRDLVRTGRAMVGFLARLDGDLMRRLRAA